MLNKLKDSLNKLKNSEEFKNKEGDAYLCACFLMDKAWQIDYYSKSKDEIFTFIIDENIKVKSDKVFKGDYEISELKIDNLKEYKEIRNIVDDLLKKKYEKDKINKSIIILQNYRGKATWNITFLTTDMKIINIKINGENGRIIDDSIQDVLNFRK